MNSKFIKKIFFYNTFIFIFFGLVFLFFPSLDIYLSNLFFFENQFISEKYTMIKVFRTYLKNIMIFIPVLSLIILFINFTNKRQNVRKLINQRTKFALIGLVVGPILGCGIIANMYFKDTWGRARPVHIEEFGGGKIFTPAFLKSDQCEKNCSWISGETSAAFSLIVGSILLKKPIFFFSNVFLGFFVFFCRLSMGGHFFSDNVFAMIFMIYLALLYRYIIYLYLKKKLFYEKKSSYNQCDSLLHYLKEKVKFKIEFLRIEREFIHNLPNFAIYVYLFVRSFFKKDENKRPDIIISCGRISAPYSLLFKKLNKECKIFHILDPYFLRSYFDKILIPSHDFYKFSNCRNVLEFLGTFVSKRKLVNEDLNNYKELELRKKIIACLIGGDGKSSKLKDSEIINLVDKINLISEKYTVVYCFSRRTSVVTKKIIEKRKKLKHYCYDYKDKDPYWFLMNKSSHFIVTEDSVSMISDAAFTGKPIYLVKIKNKKNKIRNFVQNLEKKGVVRYFDGEIESWKYETINESKRIANIIKKII